MSIYDPWGLYPQSSRQDMTVITNTSINIMWGENPDFAPSDFLQYLPEFIGLVDDATKPYYGLFNVYAVLASSELSEKRYNDVWKYVMSLYIAHKLQIRFSAITSTSNLTDALTKAKIIASNNVFAASSESVGGVSVSYDTSVTLTESLNGGDWNRTQYGQELLTYMSKYSIGAWIVG